MEAAERNGENLVAKEFIEGDNLGFLLEEALFTPKETRDILRQLCQALWVLVNVMLTGEHPSKKLAEGHLGRVVQCCIQADPRSGIQMFCI